MNNKFKIHLLIIAVLGLLFFFIPNVTAQDSTAKESKEFSRMMQKGESIAAEVSKAVGVSISPLLGMSVLGGYTYYTTPADQRYLLPWHSSPYFWGPLFILLIAVIFKDTLKAVLPVPKTFLTPLDALEAVENKVSGLLAVPFILSSITAFDSVKMNALIEKSVSIFSSAAYAGTGTGIQAAEPASIAGYAVTSAFVLFCFFIVWLVSHTINVLILLCPFAVIDCILKGIRTAVIAFLLAASLINPYLGLFVSLVIVVFAYFAASWSFRFMVFGSIISWDILLRRRAKCDPKNPEVKAFASKDMNGVPNMSYGTLKQKKNYHLEFKYRPWLLFPAKTVITKDQSENYVIGRGFLSPVILKIQDDGRRHLNLFRLRPMYKSYEQYVALNTGIYLIRDVGVSKNIKDGWKWLCMQFKTERKSNSSAA